MIFYFSGTGNTKWAANRVASMLNEQPRFIPDELSTDMEYTLAPGECLGFIIPVHGWRPPVLVRNFIAKSRFHNAGKAYTYVIYTAGDSIGKALEILESDLSRHKIHVSTAISLIMPESYIGLPFMDVDKEDRELAKKRQAATDLDTFVEKTLLARAEGVRLTVKGPIPAFFSGPVGSFFVKYLITDKRFHVDENKCLLCGKCAAACPVNNIDGGKDKSPVWKHTGDCLTCFACYHHCPVHAIEFGRQTQKKGQYYYDKRHHNGT